MASSGGHTPREPDGTCGGAAPVPVDVCGLTADRGALAALARVALAARRAGFRVRLCGASAPLRALVELVGLAGQFEWEPEEREEVLDVEEGVQRGDPPL
ncbi:hypothetical protein SAMN05216223_103212 [Actinacidiphila yanglinensis]|uniref:STAS domain-containing protein n=1 Tax=Actinacidiphila yanglinensis TaxID=310779 RepID=A0A1H5XDX2_9ACTN|nr:hypothetical protein SAMN05216223_103212 [Actinacidiphila yanglinensis]